MADLNADLQLYLKLNKIKEVKEGSSTRMQVNDFSSHERHGIVQGNPTVVSDDRFGSCLKFKDADDAVEVNSILKQSETCTLMFWVKPDSSPEGTIVAGNSFSLTHQDSAWKLINVLAEPYSLELKNGEWNHFTVTSKKQESQYTIQIYLNGAELKDVENSAYQSSNDFASEFITLKIGSNFKGAISNVRVYNSALVEAEIRQCMEADETALSAFRATHPIEFELYNQQDEAVLYITDTADQTLTLQLTNTSDSAITFTPKGTVADQDNYHLQLRFRPNTLSRQSQERLDALKQAIKSNDTIAINQFRSAGFEPNDWSLNYGFDQNDQTEWISLLWIKASQEFNFPQKAVQTLKIPFLSAAAAGGARGTRVYLKYANLSIPAGERSHYLNIINRSGKEYIPLHIGFVGSNTILNDGITPNELTLRITNISTKDTIKFAKSRTSASNASRFSIYFDLQQDKQEKPWALATITQISGLNIKLDSVSSTLSNLRFQPVGQLAKNIDQKDEIELESALSQNIPEGSTLNIIEYENQSKQKIKKSQFIKTSKIANQGQKTIQIEDGITFKANSEVQEVTFTPPSNTGSSASSKWEPDVSFQREFPIWTFTYIGEQETALLPHEYIELELSNLLSSMPSGYTNLYIHYEDIPDYWDGNYTCLIEKAPLLYRQNPDKSQFANNVGIGTDEPKAKLHVSVVRENEKVVPNEKQPAAIFMGGGVGIGVAPGSDQLKVQGNTAIAGNLSITNTDSSNGKVGIGIVPGTERLKVQGDTAIAGNLSITNGKVGIGVGIAATDSDQLKVQGNTAISGNLSITNGKVGIGVGIAATDSDQLKVRGNTAIAGNLSITNGKVGIGVGIAATDSDQLKVQGDTAIAGNLSISNGRIGIGSSKLDKEPLVVRAQGTQQGLIAFEDPSGIKKWHIEQNFGGNSPGLNFVETGVADFRLFIKAGGHIGINTKDPTIHLAIGDHDTGIRWNKDGDLSIMSNGKPRITINPDDVVIHGKVSVEGQIWSNYHGSFWQYINNRPEKGFIWTSSDVQLKKETFPLQSTLPLIEKLKPISYYWKDVDYFLNQINEDFPDFSLLNEQEQEVLSQYREVQKTRLEKQQFGFIAQDLEQVFPDWVRTGGDGYKQISLEMLPPFLVQAIQELKQKFDELVVENEKLNDRLTVLETQNNH